MPSTRKQKANARRSRELEMLSDILEIRNIIWEIKIPNFNSFEREVANSLKGSVGPNDDFTNSVQSQRERSSQEDEIRASTRNAALEFANRQATREKTDLLAEEVNYSVSREIYGLMDSVSTQVNRAVNKAINVQVLPQKQSMIRELNYSAQGPSRSKGPELDPKSKFR